MSRARRIAASVTCGVGGGGRRSCRPWRRRPWRRRRASPGWRRTTSKPCSRGGAKPNSSLQRVEEGRGRAFEDAHGAVALDVAVAAHRADPGAGAADVAAQQQEVDDLADGGDRVLVLGQAHRPADDDAPRTPAPWRAACSISLARQAGGAPAPRPSRRRGRRAANSSKPWCARSMKSWSSTVPGAASSASSSSRLSAPEQRQVAAEPDLQEQVGERGAAAGQPRGRLRVLEPLEPGLGQRVDGDDPRAAALGLLQRGEHPRVVGARVLAGDDDQVGLVEVLQRDAALADADGLGERGAGRLVAHVGAVRQVVGAELAGEQLVEERGLVAGAARRCRRPPRRASPARVSSSATIAKASSQVDRLVVVGALGQVHRLGEPALLARASSRCAGPGRRPGARRRSPG